MITCLVFLWQVVVKTTGGSQEKNISLTQLLNDADQGKISDVTVSGAEVTGHYRDDRRTSSTPPFRATTPTCTRRCAITASTSPSRIRARISGSAC